MEQTLKIYFTSDVHGYFYPTTYGDLKRKDLGLFSFARDFKKDENTLVIDGGDILQGSAFAYYCRQKSGSPQAIVDIMNDCGYDYYTLGNHDFNYGMDYQNAYIEAHHGACVCQNVVDEAGRACHPYVIHTLGNGLRVGIVGIVTDYVNVWERKENLAGICITDPFEAAKEALLHLKKEVDITLCIYHGGFECDLKTGERLQKTTENVGYRICKELDFDILLTGHQHMSVDGSMCTELMWYSRLRMPKSITIWKRSGQKTDLLSAPRSVSPTEQMLSVHYAKSMPQRKSGYRAGWISRLGI